MKNKLAIMIGILLLVATIPLITSWTPTDNIKLRNYYNITGTNFIKGWNYMEGINMSGDIDMRNYDLLNIGKAIVSDWSDANYNILLSEENITDENWIEDSQEGNLNVNYSDNSDKLDGEDGSYYLDNTDDQTLSVDTTNVDDKISIENGNEVTINDDYEANTNTQLDDEQPTSNVDMNSKNMTNVDCIQFNSGGEICSA